LFLEVVCSKGGGRCSKTNLVDFSPFKMIARRSEILTSYNVASSKLIWCKSHTKKATHHSHNSERNKIGMMFFLAKFPTKKLIRMPVSVLCFVMLCSPAKATRSPSTTTSTRPTTRSERGWRWRSTGDRRPSILTWHRCGCLQWGSSSGGGGRGSCIATGERKSSFPYQCVHSPAIPHRGMENPAGIRCRSQSGATWIEIPAMEKYPLQEGGGSEAGGQVAVHLAGVVGMEVGPTSRAKVHLPAVPLIPPQPFLASLSLFPPVPSSGWACSLVIAMQNPNYCIAKSQPSSPAVSWLSDSLPGVYFQDHASYEVVSFCPTFPPLPCIFLNFKD